MKSLPRMGLVTFGAGSPNWRAAARRLGRQAEESGRFTKISVSSDQSLRANYPEFFQQHRGMLRPEVRGFGYWLWKPFLIQRAMQTWVNEVDCVLYVDGGCEINFDPESQDRWEQYLDWSMQGPGRLAMQLVGHSEQTWSKTDTMLALGLTLEERLSDQIQTAPSFYRLDSSNLDFSAEWLEMCIIENYRFVDDTQSRVPNDASFRDHRHDQAIFSGLIKRHGARLIPDETYWAPDWELDGRRFPIWAPRNRTRVSILDKSVSGKAIRFSERLYSKIYREINASRFSGRMLKE